VLDNPPARAGSSWNQIPSNTTDYADYVSHVVARYGPGGAFWTAHPELQGSITYYEVWNEPYTVAFSAGGVDPARYARLVKAAAIAGRAANPQAKFIMEGENTYTNDAGAHWTPWIDSLFNAVPDLANYFDAVAPHPYSDDMNNSKGRMDAARQQLANHGAGNRPYWITEIGWATCTNGSPGDCVTEQDQANKLTAFFNLVNSRQDIAAVFVYHLYDLGSGNPSDREQWFGLLRHDRTPKPAWNTLRQITGAA
jgi:hypothetical protein